MPDLHHKPLRGSHPTTTSSNPSRVSTANTPNTYALNERLRKRLKITEFCQATDCGLPLSRYNPTTTCWMHDYDERANV